MPSAPDPQDVEKNKVFAILAYILILFLVPLLAAKDSRFARYHTNQGVVLFLFGAGASVVSTVIWIIPIIGWLIGCFLAFALPIWWLVMAVIGILNAAQGHEKPLPLIGHIVLMK
jgi:uncharacterized membrane protein